MDSDVTTTTGVLGLPAIGEEGQRLQRTASGFSGSVHADTTEACHERRRMRAASVGSLHVEELWSSHDPTAMSGDDDTDPATPDDDDHALLTGLCTAKAKSRGSSETGRMQPLRVRRRFHSSDVVLCTAAPTPTTAAFHPPRGGLDSPTLALRQWLASNNAELSPAHLRRHRQHRRAQSTDYTSRHCRQQEYHGMRRSSESSRPANYYYHNAIAEEIFHDDSFHDGDGPVNDESEDDVLDSESERESESESDQAESDVENLRLAPRSRRTGSDNSNGSESSSFDSNAVGRSYDSVPQENPPSVEKLLNLQKLYQEGFITVTEYTNRRRQLVDELSVSKANQTINRTTDLIQRDLPVIHREPPDFTVLRERDAIKHVFDSEKRKWTSSRIKVKIDPQPFARGGLRQVFHVQDLSVIPRLGLEGRPVSYVAKIAMDENEDPDTYFRDVEMQAVASKFAKLYNSYNPPRRVEFLDAWILQLVPASNMGDDDNLTMRGTICGVEPYIAGEYHKHNNNFGYVSELERNTPQAFSHFTYEASGQQMLIVDIQGVSDHYTDPQIHTRSGKEFGKGNLSTRGFERFLESHRCNPICRYLKLPLGNPKDDGDGQEVGAQNGTQKDGRGTVPAQTYMSQPRIKRVDSELCHYYGDSKAFKKYQAKHQQHEHADVATSAFVAALKEQRHCSSFCGVGLCTIS